MSKWNMIFRKILQVKIVKGFNNQFVGIILNDEINIWSDILVA